jgi:hypothetical protein
MKDKAIWIFYFFILQSCKPPDKAQSLNQNSHNVLLQEKRGWPRFIVLIDDIAYYERRQFEKASYFTDFDTLIRNISCDCYRGKNVDLYLSDNTIRLKYVKGKDIGKELFFLFASDKQIKQWNYYKNIDMYNLNAGYVRNLLYANASNLKFYKDLKQDWEKLLPLTLTLNQKDFDLELSNFKLKYSLR